MDPMKDRSQGDGLMMRHHGRTLGQFSESLLNLVLGYMDVFEFARQQ